MKIIYIILLPVVFYSCSYNKGISITLSCREDNDLYLVLKENKIKCIRYNTPQDAVDYAKEGTSVMILADNYPEKTTELDTSLFNQARLKKLRLYVEYPSGLPQMVVGSSRRTQWERAVISSEKFSPSLKKLSILAIHDCHFVPVKIENPDIVMARVAGFDHADFGLPDTTFPILFVIPSSGHVGDLMVSTTKLSMFITGRYAPFDAWQSIWKTILTWLLPDRKITELEWTPTVRPTFNATALLPENVEQNALKRGINWYFNSGMIMSPSITGKYAQPSNGPEPASSDPDPTCPWPFGHRVGYMPDLDPNAGDGSLGVLEGFDAKIFPDGGQPVRWWRRGDCNGEVAGAMAVSGLALKEPKYQKTGKNIGDWLYFKSMISLGDRSDPDHPASGLLGWADVPEYLGPGTMNCYEVYYGDDQARNILGMILAGAALGTDRYNRRLMEALLANLRLTGPLGFQPDRIDQVDLEHNGWEYYFNLNTVSYSGNFQAYMWACYLWAYKQTGFELFLKRAKAGIYAMMASYPYQWGITGIQTDRARMVLPLAWLIRIEDTPKHRLWLRMVVKDMELDWTTGTFPEKIEAKTTRFGTGHYRSPECNEDYGTVESSVIQRDGDPGCDLLYTVNFAFAGLHEATAVTRDRYYGEAEEKLAKFLSRVQIRSESHPEFDGGWFRAFNFKRWEYWASNSDTGWGAWCIESGWSQSWITIILALRQLNTSFWDITSNSNIETQFGHFRKKMIPDEVLGLTTQAK
jgi:hypothetical protein